MNAFTFRGDEPLTFIINVRIGDYTYEYVVKFFHDDSDLIYANEKLEITELNDDKEIFLAQMEVLKQKPPRFEGEKRFKGPGFGNFREEIKNDFSYLKNSILIKIFQEGHNNTYSNIYEPFYAFWDDLRFYDFNEYDKDKICKETEISNDILLEEDFQNLMTVLMNISFQQKRVFDEIKEWLVRLMPNMKDIIIQTSDRKGKAFLSFTEKDWGNRFAPLTQASDGIIRLLCLLTILFNEKKPRILIFDEPENGLHPAIRRYVADFCIAASDDVQVIVLTHDSESLRTFDLEMIYYFRRKQGSAEVKQLSNEKSLTETMKALNDVEKNTIVSTHLSDSL